MSENKSTDEELNAWATVKIQNGDRPCFGCRDRLADTCIFLKFRNKQGCPYRKRWMLMTIGAAEDCLHSTNLKFTFENVKTALANLVQELELDK